jgi:PAS domain S-box-containing protein
MNFAAEVQAGGPSQGGAAATSIKLLVIEDSEDDARLAMRTLRRGGFEPICCRVQDRDALKAALETQPWDAVLSDFTLPGFDGLEALALFQSSGIDIPFIFVSGTIGEAKAVEAMKAGASDYVVKDDLTRLAPALARELAQARSRAERRQAQAERDRYVHLLQTVIDSTMAVIYVKDVQGRYLLVNRRFEEALGLANEAIVGRGDSELFPAGTAAGLRAGDRRVVDAQMPLIEEEAVSLRGDARTYISVKCPFRDRDGRIQGVLGISTDITDRKRAEEALRVSEERMRLIVDTALDAVVTIDGTGAITGWNPQADDVFGWHRYEVLGKPLAEAVIPPQYREAHRRGLARYLQSGEAVVLNKRIELTALHRDGREFPIELAITPLRGAEGVSFCAFVRDITERKSAEARLHAHVERLNLLDQITRAIGERQDLQSIYQVAVRSLEERLPVDFCCVCRYDDANDGTLVVASLGARSQALATGIVAGERIVLATGEGGLVRCLDGEPLYEPDVAQLSLPFAERLARAGLRSLVLAPLVSEGHMLGIVLAARLQSNSFSSGECEFLRQLSAHIAVAAQQAQLHSSLQRAYDDLRLTQQAVLQQERLRVLGQMASGIAHDINNAISPALLYAESLLEGEPTLSAHARSHLESIARAISDVADTVARMRDFYRPREPQLELLPVSMNELARQVAELTRARWCDMPQQRGAVIDLRLDLADELPAVMGIESELRDALINLVFNAVDAMPDGGELILRTREERSGDTRHVEVDVADTGVGMDEDTCRRCLEPFFTTKGERGTGLGLAMVYGATQRHGADIDIRSVPGRGTTLVLRFPAPQAAMTQAREAPDADARPPCMRILVVDDDPLLLRTLQDVLEADGHEVIAAPGGQAGIDAFNAAQAQGKPFAVVLTDMGMPYVDGRKVASAIKKAEPDTPVILLTGWGQRLVDDAIADHVDVVLGKPPKLKELRRALARTARGETHTSHESQHGDATP